MKECHSFFRRECANKEVECHRCRHYFDDSGLTDDDRKRGVSVDDLVEANVKAIADKYGRWEQVMKGGKYVTHKIISKRSWEKMLKELIEHFS